MTDSSRKPTDDAALLAELRAGPTLEEAQSSLDYWRRRRRSLPFYRRTARREADEMIRSWSESARVARRRRYRPSLIERVADAVGLDPSDGPRVLGRVVRRTALAAGALVVVAVVLAVVLAVALWPELEPIIRLLIQVGGGSATGREPSPSPTITTRWCWSRD